MLYFQQYFQLYRRQVLGAMISRQLGLPDVRFLEGGSNKRHHQNPEKLAGADVTLVLNLEHPGCTEELRPLAEGGSKAGGGGFTLAKRLSHTDPDPQMI